MKKHEKSPEFVILGLKIVEKQWSKGIYQLGNFVFI